MLVYALMAGIALATIVLIIFDLVGSALLLVIGSCLYGATVAEREFRRYDAIATYYESETKRLMTKTDCTLSNPETFWETCRFLGPDTLVPMPPTS